MIKGTFCAKLTLALLFLASRVAWADELPAETAEAKADFTRLKPISQLNLSSALEPASAHEPLRFYLSAGAGSINLADEQLQRQHASVTTGLFYPVDLSVSFAQLQKASGTQRPFQLASYLQWTLYEAFAFPALALRLHWARLYGLVDTSVQTLSPSLQMSWGFQRATLFAGLAGHWHRATFRTLTESGINTDRHTQYWQQSHNWGLQWQLIPGFLALAGEVVQSRESKQYQGQVRIEF